MPKYTVQDEETGKTITFDWMGDGEPSDTDFEDVFKSSREFVSEKNKSSDSTPNYEELLKNYPISVPTPTPVTPKMLKNLPGSVLDVGAGMVKTLANIPETARSLGRVAAGGIEKLVGTGTGEHIPNWDAFTQGVKDRYGSLGNLYKTMETDPAGFVTDVSSVAGVGGGLSGAARAGTKATNLAYGVAKGTGKALGKAEDIVVGALSGTTPKIVGKAREWSKDYRDTLWGSVTGEDVVGKVKTVLDTVSKSSEAQYRAKLAQIDQTGVMVNPANAFGRFDQLLKENRVTRNIDGTLDFKGSLLERQKPKQAELNKINGYLLDRTIGGIPYPMLPTEVDAMKKWMWLEEGGIDPTRNAHVKAIADQMYGALKQTLDDQVPGYKDFTAEAHKYLEWKREFDKAFAIGDKASVESAITKLKTTAKSDKEYRQSLSKQFKDLTGTDLEAMIAGLDMHEGMPRGLYGRSMATGTALGAYGVSPWLAALFPFTFPRAAGTILQLQSAAPKALSVVGKNKIADYLLKQTPNVLYETGQVREKSKPKSVLYGGE